VITDKDLTDLVKVWHHQRKGYQDKAYQLRKKHKEAEFYEGISQGLADAIDTLEGLIQRRGGK
jgi:hypothetical protein